MLRDVQDAVIIGIKLMELDFTGKEAAYSII